MSYYKTIDDGFISQIGSGDYGTAISEQEYNELLQSVTKFSECSDEELKKIVGGRRTHTKVTTTTYYDHYDHYEPCRSAPMPAIGAVFIGSAMGLIGLGVAISGIHKCRKDGIFAPM